jgi:chemotaxis protein CheX
VDVRYVNPFILSTIETFNIMLKLKVTPGKPQLKMDPFPTHDISGIIGISGDAVGTIAISYPRIVALKTVSRFLDAEFKIFDYAVTDAIGEITNIIAGSAKKDLGGLNVQISLPNVVIGRNHRLVGPKNAQNILVPLQSELGSMYLEVSLKTP